MDDTHLYRFHCYAPLEKRLLTQIVSSIAKIPTVLEYENANEVHFRLTPSQYKGASEAYTYYRKLLTEERETFFTNFCHRHHLCTPMKN